MVALVTSDADRWAPGIPVFGNPDPNLDNRASYDGLGVPERITERDARVAMADSGQIRARRYVVFFRHGAPRAFPSKALYEGITRTNWPTMAEAITCGVAARENGPAYVWDRITGEYFTPPGWPL